MSSSVLTGDSYDRRTVRRLSTWSKGYLRRTVFADLGCAALGVFAAAQLRFGDDVTSNYVVLSLTLPVLWLFALTLGGIVL